METRWNRAWDVARMVVAGGAILLSTVAMSPSQTTPTPTAIAPVINTELPTATLSVTPTFTPTATPTPSPTLGYPSASEIKKTLKSDFDQINARLDAISQKTEPPHLVNIADNLVSNGIWKILVFGVSLLGGARIFIGAKARQAKAEGKSPPYADLAQSLSSGFTFLLIMLIAYFLIPMLFLVGQITIQSIGMTQLDTISQKLDRIEGQMKDLPQVTPTSSPRPYDSTNPGPSNNPDLIIPAAIASGMVLVFLGVGTIIARNQTRFYEVYFGTPRWQELGRKLLPAGFLVLILNLLPRPVEILLLPLLVPFFIFALFDVVLLYPNHHLKRIVIKYHSALIFLAVFGVWYGTFELVREYSYPIFEILRGSFTMAVEEILNNQETINRLSFVPSRLLKELPRSLVDSAWGLLPLALGIIFAIGPSRRIRRVTEERYIPELRKSTETGASKHLTE